MEQVSPHVYIDPSHGPCNVGAIRISKVAAYLFRPKNKPLLLRTSYEPIWTASKKPT